MCLRAQQHAADQVCGRDVWRPLEDEEAVSSLDKTIAVFSASVRGDIVPMSDIPAAIMRDPRQGCHIGRMWDDFGNPSTSVAGSMPLIKGHDRRALVLEDLFIGVESDIEFFAQLTGLTQCTGMTWTD